jgi:hypothetical protein
MRSTRNSRNPCCRIIDRHPRGMSIYSMGGNTVASFGALVSFFLVLEDGFLVGRSGQRRE